MPSFVFSVPRGWLLDEAPDALAVIRTPDEVEGFWANAILSHDRVARAVDFDAAAKVTFAQLKRTNPEADGGLRAGGPLRHQHRLPAGHRAEGAQVGPRLAQLHALFFAPAADEGKTVDFFQIVATSPADEHRALRPCVPRGHRLVPLHLSHPAPARARTRRDLVPSRRAITRQSRTRRS